jgi:hypothetical protein
MRRVSDPVGKSVRKQPQRKSPDRYKDMTYIIATWKDREDIKDSAAYVRELRKDRRFEPLR